LLALYTGTQVSDLTQVASSDDAYPGAPGGFSALSQAVLSNQTYRIAVDGFDGASGVVYLAYTFTPATVFSLTTSAGAGGQVSPPFGLAVSNSTVVVVATPDLFFEFDSWTGSLSSIANPLSVVVNSNLILTARFRQFVFTDDFETGDLSKLPWTSAPGSPPWTVQANTVLRGNFSAQSGAIGNGQSTSLLLTTNFHDGAASFYLKVSSEPDWDFLSFSVDDVEQQRWSGQVDWTGYSFPLTAGNHKLEWRYSKDASFSSGSDAAFIDNVLLPIGLPIDASTPAYLEMVRQPDGSLLLMVLGQTNRQYVIQGATSLTSPIGWQNLSTNIATGGVIQYVDPGTGTNPIRYYRAIVP
jgi:hypothetical protein